MLCTIQRTDKETTFQRFTVGIGPSQTFECQFLPATEGVNPPKIEFFDALPRLEAGLAQFGNTIGQHSQAIGHQWFWSLILDQWREQKLIDPRGLITHIHENPLLLVTLLATLEGGIDVFIPVVTSQGKADPAEDCLDVLGRRIIVPEKASILRDSQPALAQHYEAAKYRNSIGVEMN
jgi:hypothetical protein